MAELYYDEGKGAAVYRQGLRSPYIDYCNGWFFITFQVAKNKSVLGVIIGEECVLNELGMAVREAWLSEAQHVPELHLFDFQVMPNHFHALLYYGAAESARVPPPDQCGLKPRRDVEAKYSRDARARDLPYAIGLFKSWTTKIYYRLKDEGRCIDIGPKLWQDSFYDELVRSEDQFHKTTIYIRNNPANWNLDRFGPVTQYAEGNLDLLQEGYVAYVSSEGYERNFPLGKTPIRRVYGATPGLGGPGATSGLGGPGATSGLGVTEPGRRPIISTFTSYYERQVLDKCLKHKRGFIWVCPGGIVPDAMAKAASALKAGNALLLSPVSSGTGVNKQRANWCNQFLVKNADEVWVGHIRAGGSLESILKGNGRNIYV